MLTVSAGVDAVTGAAPARDETLSAVRVASTGRWQTSRLYVVGEGDEAVVIVVDRDARSYLDQCDVVIVAVTCKHAQHRCSVCSCVDLINYVDRQAMHTARVE